jgi:dTDP-4-amino-4,6-dideoxygalactose transaminase
LDGVLLAGMGAMLAEVSPRLTLDLPMSERVHPASNVAVLIAHTFGYRSGYRAIDNHWEHNIVTIEDVVQGVGGQVGQIGTLVIVGFHETKMLPGRGGAVLTDDPALWEALKAINLAEPCPAPMVEPPRYAAYRQSVEMRRAELLLPFNPDPENVERIRLGLRTLPERVQRHNAKAHWLREHLLDLPLHLPEVLPGDAVWRYTFAAPDRRSAGQIMRGLQRAGLRGSDNYAALSTLFQERPNPIAAGYHGRLINLFVDDQTTTADLQRMVEVIHEQFKSRQTAKFPL